MIAVADIAEQLNELAPSLAPELLPNGHRSGNKWMFSGIPDHGKSASAYVHLAVTKVGHWIDLGNAAPGEEKGDMLDGALKTVRSFAQDGSANAGQE